MHKQRFCKIFLGLAIAIHLHLSTRNTNTHIWVLPIAMLTANFVFVIYYNV